MLSSTTTYIAAGTAREHLRQWIAAASVVQRAVRAWLLRRGLQRFAERRLRGVAAVVRLQALWRARQPYRQYQALREAAITVQVCRMGAALDLIRFFCCLLGFTALHAA